MQRLFKRDLIYVIVNQGLLSLCSALIVILLARYTDQVTFGELRYLIAVLAILAFWSLPGISMVINHEASRMTKRDLVSLIHTQLTWGLGAFAGALVVATVHLLQDQHALAQAFVIGGLLAPVANLYLVPGVTLAGIRRFRQKMIVDALIMATVLAGVVIGALNTESLSGIIIGYLGLQAGASVVGLFYVARLLPQENRGVASSERKADRSDGTQLTFLQIPFSLIPAIEKAVIFIVLGPVSLAIFVIAVLPVEHFKTAFRNLMQFYMLPHLVKRDVNLLLHWFGTGALVLTLGIMALVLFIIYGMPLLFENFEEAKRLSLLLVLAALPLPIHVIMVNWIAKRRLKTLRVYAALAIVTNVAFIALSAFFFGLIGAVLAKIIYELLLAAGLLQLDKQYKLPEDVTADSARLQQ